MLFDVEINGAIINDQPLAYPAAMDLMMENLPRNWGRLVRVSA